MALQQEHIQLLLKSLKKIDQIKTTLSGEEYHVFNAQFGRLKSQSIKAFTPDNIATLVRDLAKWQVIELT